MLQHTSLEEHSENYTLPEKCSTSIGFLSFCTGWAHIHCLPPPPPAAQLEEKTLSQNSYMLLIFHSRDSHTRQLRGHVSIRFPSVPVITSPKSQPLCPDPSLSSMKVGNMISKRKLIQLHNRLGVFYRSVMRNLFPEIVFGGCSLQYHCVCFSLCTQCC